MAALHHDSKAVWWQQRACVPQCTGLYYLALQRVSLPAAVLGKHCPRTGQRAGWRGEGRLASQGGDGSGIFENDAGALGGL